MEPEKRFRLLAGDTAEAVRRAVVAGLSEKLREQPQAFAKLVELGLVDADLLDRDPKAVDLVDTVRQFRERIAEIAQTEPSVLERLDVRPLEVLGGIEGPRGLPASTHLPAVIVFSDLEGFTAFTHERGDHEAGDLLRVHYASVEAIVRSRGGRVIKTLGDGHMLSFAEPAAAVMAAVELVKSAPAPLRLRVGAHSGPVMRAGHDLFGNVVNIASRVADAAGGGMALVTAAVREGAGTLPGVVFVRPRAAQLPGLEEPVDVFEVEPG